MTRISVPISDDYSFGWTPTPIYEKINEIVPLDDKWVSTTGGTFQVQMEPFPAPPQGTLTVLMHLRQIGSGSMPVTVTLLQGASTVVATRTYNAGPSFANLSPPFVLSSAEQALITDFTNLYLQVSTPGASSSSGNPFGPSSSSSSPSSGGPGSSSSEPFGSSASGSSSSTLPSSSSLAPTPICGTLQMPTTLYATLAPLFHCPNAVGTITLTWNGATWTGTGPFGPYEITLKLTGNTTSCESYTLAVSFAGNCDDGSTAPELVSCNCTPDFYYGITWTPGHCGCLNGNNPVSWKVTITA